MIEKSIYENYEIEFGDKITPDDNDLVFIFNNNREVYIENYNCPKHLKNIKSNFYLHIGKYKSRNVFVGSVDSNEEFYSLQEIYDFDQDLYLITTRAVLIHDWYLSHQFCGRCGAETVIDDKDMMLKCPKCGQVHYPRISPAVIVAIRKDDKLLMAKHSYHKSNLYALIAGFVEPAESIEEAVKREIKEEVGINIKNLKYLKSQSWPFPNSLMLGFICEYDSGDINVDGDEIVDAKWFSKDEIQRYDSDISISDWLVQYFIDH